MLIEFEGKLPKLHPSVFVAPGAHIIGDVEIGEDASIWYNVVVRGDVNHIRIGARTNIQDGTVVHVESGDKPGGGFPTLIGSEVLIGHMAMLHGCILRDRAFVGLGATVMDACEIESDGMLAAGALLPPGKRILARQLWVGRPARYVRDLTDREIAANRAGIERYIEVARRHRSALSRKEAPLQAG